MRKSFIIRIIILLMFLAAFTAYIFLPEEQKGLDISREKIVLSGDIIDISETNLNLGDVPSIIEPKFEKISDAQKYLEQDSLGIGVNYGGIQKFYPNQILVWHYAVNDTVGNEEILISYCPFCSSSVVYSREINGKVYTFEASTKLWNDNFLLREMSPNPSLWSTLYGESIYGDYSGVKLELLKSENTTFGEWTKKNPNSLVLSRDTGFKRPYELNPFNNPDIFTGFGDDKIELNPKTFIGFIEYEDQIFGVSYDRIITEKLSTISKNDLKITFKHLDQKLVSVISDSEKNLDVELEVTASPYFILKSIYPKAILLI